MKAVIQRVTEASVRVEGKTVAAIETGYLILLGVMDGDGEAQAELLAKKVAELRVIEDENGKMNLSLQSTGGAALVVSQFTLCGDCSHGNRPYFGDLAEEPARAEELYELFKRECAARISGKVAAGVFGAEMKVSLTNDGPFTIVLRCRDGKIE